MLLRRHCALLVFISVLSLCGLGIVMLYSATAFSPTAQVTGDSEVFLKSQGLWLFLGLMTCAAAAILDYRIWAEYMWWILGAAVVGLALCYVPHVGLEVKGARRWIGYGGMSLQPSEFAKVALLLFLAVWYDRHIHEVRTLVKGFLIPALVAGVVLALIAFEQDVGTTVLLAGVTGVLWMIVGVRWYYLAFGVGLALAGAGAIVWNDPGRLQRVAAFAGHGDESKVRETNWQQTQAKIALGSGGAMGLGPGQSRQKNQFLPDAHTDFIFAIIGEELGLRATLAVIFGFVVFITAGGYIATRAPDVYGTVLASGIVILIGMQVFINIGVVTGVLPNKGIALPFISKGGSSLLSCLMMTGLIVSIARTAASPGSLFDEEPELFVVRVTR